MLVLRLLQTDKDKRAKSWRDRLNKMASKQRRKLLKTPAMTFAYSATPTGMADEIAEVYRDLFGDAPLHARFLAAKVHEACEELLPAPAAVMQYIRDLAEYRADQKPPLPLEWKNPTGFPIANRYFEPKTETVYLVRDKVEVRYRVADGAGPKIRKPKSLNSAAPNFVHSLDAAHLIRTVNAAVSEDITEIITVHDSFACLAPQAKRFSQLIRIQLGLLYYCYDALANLRRHNAPGFRAPPPRGNLDEIAVQNAEYCWS